MTGLDLHLPEWTVNPVEWMISAIIEMTAGIITPVTEPIVDGLSVAFSTPERALLFGILVTLVLILLTMWDTSFRIARAGRQIHWSVVRTRRRFVRFLTNRF